MCMCIRLLYYEHLYVRLHMSAIYNKLFLMNVIMNKGELLYLSLAAENPVFSENLTSECALVV